jgi:peptidoglycan-associated lipoprotein
MARWLRAGLALCLIAGGCASSDPPAEITRSSNTAVGIRPGPGMVECGYPPTDCDEMHDRVLFADESAVIDGDRNMNELNRIAARLAKDPMRSFTVEGHADESGTPEHNLALGVRRAIALRDALVARGIAADRLSIISYGKERPAIVGSDEAARAENRRAVVTIN